MPTKIYAYVPAGYLYPYVLENNDGMRLSALHLSPTGVSSASLRRDTDMYISAGAAHRMVRYIHLPHVQLMSSSMLKINLIFLNSRLHGLIERSLTGWAFQ